MIIVLFIKLLIHTAHLLLMTFMTAHDYVRQDAVISTAGCIHKSVNKKKFENDHSIRIL